MEARMFDGGKFTFWDIGNYLIIGFFSSLVIFFYYFILFFDGGLKSFNYLKDYLSVLVVIMPFLFMFLGMIIEPIANWCIKKIENNIKFLGVKDSRSKSNIKAIIEKNIPSVDLKSINLYRYCKSVVEKDFPGSNHDVFLARFGFYRSMSFLMMVIVFLNLYYFPFSCMNFLCNAFILFLFYQFLRRSQNFKNHMEDVVYYNYLALVIKINSKE